MIAPLSNVASVDTPDNYTVVFKMLRPYTPLLYLLETPLGAILPEHLYSGTNILTNQYNYAPVGSGPFKFAEWKRGEYVKVIRNDKYFKGGQPYLDQIIFKVIPDSTSRVIALRSGDINYLWYYTVPYSAIPQLMNDPNLVYTFGHVDDAPDMTQIFLNLRNPILNHTDVRHALTYAINKTELVEKVAFGIAKEAVGPVPSTYGPAIFDPNLHEYAYNVDKANELLDKAGYPRGSDGTRFSLELTWQVENQALSRAGELLKSQLGQVGISLKLAPRDRATLIDTVFNRWQYDMLIHPMGTGPIVDVGVSRLYVSSNIGHNAFNNAAGYSNPTVDALWADAARTVDPARRTQDLYKIQEILVQDMPHVWLWEQKSIAIWTKDIGGLHTAKTNWGVYDMQDAYSMKGSLVSPQGALKAINDARSKLTELERQGYDTTNAKVLLGQAQSAYDSGNYASAQSLAGDALRAAAAPFPWLLVGGLAVVVAVIVGVFVHRRRRRAEREESASDQT
jgi:peptide/nickel transport system substrate-binding protein